MTVQQRPTDPPLADVTWAEGTPVVPDSQIPSKPIDKLAPGYGLQQPLPHAEFNWLFRSVMRWIRWLVSKVDFHVHDGGETDASAPKVKVSQHLDWGTGGSLDVTSTGTTHEITHAGSASTKRIITGQLRAATIQATGTGAAATVNVRDSGGNNGLLDSAIIKSTNYLQTPTIRSVGISTIGSDLVVNVRSSANTNNAKLNVHRIESKNAPIAMASVKNNVMDKNIGTGPDYLGFESFSSSSTGVYTLKLNQSVDANDIIVVVTPSSNASVSPPIIALARALSGNNIFVRTWNLSGTPTNSDFSIVVYSVV
jgi:hypothetical protein